MWPNTEMGKPWRGGILSDQIFPRPRCFTNSAVRAMLRMHHQARSFVQGKGQGTRVEQSRVEGPTTRGLCAGASQSFWESVVGERLLLHTPMTAGERGARFPLLEQ